LGKIIFLDIDGTLCNELGKVPESAKEAIIKTHENGHDFFLCTGRSKAEIPEEVVQLPIRGMIGAGGGYCEVDGEVILHEVFDVIELRKLITFLEENEVEYYLESNQGLFASKNLRDRLSSLILKGTPKDSIEGQEKLQDIAWFLDLLIEDQTKIDYGDVNKVSFINQTIPYEVIHEKYDGDFYMLRSTVPIFGPDSGEIGIKNITKKTAIETVIQHLEKDKSETIAFGDGHNDLSMFEAVELGIAMGNAQDVLKDVADIVTLTHDEGGIAQALAELELYQR
jgi:Cof subfamily protein (haloacid dehalogenase superfamily)